MRYAVLPSSASLFPTALLDSALDKVRAASNDTLVQKTLRPSEDSPEVFGGPVLCRIVCHFCQLWWCLTRGAVVTEGGPGGRVGSGRGAKVRHPFCLPPAAPIDPIANVGVKG